MLIKKSKRDYFNTNLTKLLKIKLPLIQAPMAGAGTPSLIAAVSNAGALGSLAAGYMTADEILNAIKQIRKLTDRPFAINLFVPGEYHATKEQIECARKLVQAACHELNFRINHINPPYAPSFEDQLQVILEEKIPVFSFTFGIPAENWIRKFKKNNIILIGTATTLDEAKLLKKNNIDAIVAQGSEAGGHRGTFLGNPRDALVDLASLIRTFVEHINIPIIAAGGIMDASGIKTQLGLGASGVQMGTAFLCCTESGIHPLYKNMLLDATFDNTTLTRAFSGRLARGIINKFIIRMQEHRNDILDYPIQNSLTTSMRNESAKQNCTDFLSMWAGQSLSLCKALPANDFIQELNEELVKLLDA